MRELSGRTALITGASRGLGVYIARALAREGVALALAARAADGLAKVKEEVEGFGVRAVALPTDLRDTAAIERLAVDAEAAFGRIDILVNNAGVENSYTFHKLETREIDEVLDVNLRAAIHLTRLVLPGMVERRRGHVVNISSLAGKWGPAYLDVYAATKAGLVAFTQSLRASYAGTGISASVICPGFVEEAGMYADALKRYRVAAPRQLGTVKPDAVARAVVRALRKDLPEVIVNPTPIRPLLALGALAPGLADRVLKLIGANEMLRRGAQAREAEREEAAAKAP